MYVFVYDGPWTATRTRVTYAGKVSMYYGGRTDEANENGALRMLLLLTVSNRRLNDECGKAHRDTARAATI